MQGLLKRFWNWIQQFFAQVFGSSSRSERDNKNSLQQPLSDTDYEFLFSQLLDGVAHGWHEGRILKYFEDLGERGKAKLWVAWLERFGEKAISSAAPNLQLAARMMRLGELAQSFQKIEPIGQTAYDIGKKLYTKEADSAVWEYAGPDTRVTDVLRSDVKSPTLEDSLGKNPPPPPTQPPQTETLTIDELTLRLQQDPELAAQISQQLGIESTDPQTLVDALISNFEAQQPPPPPEASSETVENYYNQGVEQANLGDLEAAIALWDQALALDPSYAPAWHNRGSALGTIGQAEEAIASFDRVLALNGGDVEALNAKGQVLYSLQKWPEAIVCWDQILAVQPDYYQVWYNRGSALELMGQPSEAIASYQKAVEIEPTFELAQNRLQELSQE
ncbi:tetratricopeptide repeat protein [Crocosphaera sp. Alani8]|uniref:tetratricopeptide repeat protein n=1 Tax=Crocosphaera sp. Alani8 TaxID=3038952 RepID=UPI00313AC881